MAYRPGCSPDAAGPAISARAARRHTRSWAGGCRRPWRCPASGSPAPGRFPGLRDRSIPGPTSRGSPCRSFLGRRLTGCGGPER
ncbi:hypothetical protein ATO6_13560 [Oceanicola sp. 22II-s10i]|nr:hypothetical protein ATO6_13560 [Oceanicola sp. 22II-s10i]